MKLSEINLDEIPIYYRTYTSKVDEGNLIELLDKSLHEATNFLKNIPVEKSYYAYAPEKWNVADLIQHLIDAERIFAYRALRIARFDKTPLPSFEENDYAKMAQTNRRTLPDLINEYTTVRQSTLQLFTSFSDEMLQNTGTASGQNISVRAIGFIILGHEIHHFNVLTERYFVHQ